MLEHTSRSSEISFAHVSRRSRGLIGLWFVVVALSIVLGSLSVVPVLGSVAAVVCLLAAMYVISYALFRQSTRYKEKAPRGESTGKRL